MSVNNEIYHSLGERWYTAFDDPVALLRQETKTKAPWVIEKLRSHFGSHRRLKILDVGCGAGFLTNRLALESHEMVGLDVAAESLTVARNHDQTKSVSYVFADAYALPFPDRSFDAVSAMDFLEHVERPEQIIAEISRVLKPDGLFFFHTFNRNWTAYLVIIKFVEWFVRNTPKNMHILKLFLKPAEVEAFCNQQGMRMVALTGIRPLFSTLTLRNFLARTVPKDFAFTLTPSLKLSYMGVAKKKCEV